MSILIVIVIAIIVVVVIRNKKKTGAAVQRSSEGTLPNAKSQYDQVEEQDLSNNPVLAEGLKTLLKVVTPDKYGDYNDCKKVGKTIEKINKDVSAILQPGSSEYVEYFHSLYHTVIDSMYNSSDKKMKETMEYTIHQQEEWEKTGKCQTFRTGLSPDSLVAEAEVIMTACEKCWFKNIKATIWRKDLEKYNLPKSE